ncbi:MAG: hypothetical protein R3E55_07975 [Burkholderiaceae bacterium]
MARTAVFLAENASITGITITVDKGQHLVPLERDIMFVAGQLAGCTPRHPMTPAFLPDPLLTGCLAASSLRGLCRLVRIGIHDFPSARRRSVSCSISTCTFRCTRTRPGATGSTRW